MFLSLQKGITTPALVQRDRLDILQPSNLPHPNLPIAHPAKSRRSDTIAVSHPDYTRALDATMALGNAHGFSASAEIEQTQFAIAGSSVLVPDSPVLLASMRVGRVSIRVSALTLYLMGPSYRSTFQDT